MSDIAAWLSSLDLAEYRTLFDDNKIDLDVLPEIGEECLKSIWIPLGHRKRS